MTFLDLQQHVYRLTGYGDSPASDVSTRVKSWLNDGLNWLLRQEGMEPFRRLTFTFSTVAGQSTYALPQAFAQGGIVSIVNTANRLRLARWTRDAIRLQDPTLIYTGTPYVWCDDGWAPVSVNPASKGIWAVSTSASDTTQVISVTGIRANGEETVAATATLNGLTRQAIGGIAALTDYVQILTFTSSAVGVGDLILFDAAAAGNELARIPAGFRSVQYQRILLWPTPPAVIGMVVDGQSKVVTLSGDTDVPPIPEDFHVLLSAYARMREYERTGDARLTIAAGEWQDGWAKLRSVVAYPPDFMPYSGQSTGLWGRWNNLGGDFPPDGWGRG